MLRRNFLAAAITLLVSTGCSQTSTSMRVMAYNLEWFSENAKEERLDHIKSVLQSIQPSIVAVEEVQSRAALRQVFLDGTWELAIKDDPAEDQECGLAIRKPYQLQEFDTVFKDPGLDYAFPGGRNVLRAVVKTPANESFTFYVVHMKSRGGGRIQTDPQREMAAGMLASYIKGKKDANAVVLGDFNDCPDDVSVNILETGNLKAPGGRQKNENPLLINLFETLYDQDGVSHGLSTMYKGEDLKPFVPGAKAENEKLRGKDYNFPADVHVEQILFDQILVGPGLAKRAVGPTIYSGRDALEGKAGTTQKKEDGHAEYVEKSTRASDHLPVYVDFGVP
jgi:endonuclease/exonuclease/phosphatase family metal-dependent hydrolase